MTNQLLTNKKTIIKTKPFSNVWKNHFLYYPTPSSLSYCWSFGSLIGIFFALQIITGIFLAMHYTPDVTLAFQSVERIMTDVHGGWLYRYFHANGASAIFIFLYLHIARNIYYQSYLTKPFLWYIGLLIFLLMMATAFIGYVLPWGQMSFWGATVITSLVTAVPAVGVDIAYWVWGGFSVGNATLNRFFSLHFLMPFLIIGLVATHLVVLHNDGSSDPLALSATPSKLTFHPYFTSKDAYILLLMLSICFYLVTHAPNFLGHADNFLAANPLVTPAHIVPEWYFTPFYAILRACPNKIGGALGMLFSLLILFALPTLVTRKSFSILSPFSTLSKIAFWLFVGVFFLLMYFGTSAAAEPFVTGSKYVSFAYFGYFFLLRALGALSLKTFFNENKTCTQKYYKNGFVLFFVLPTSSYALHVVLFCYLFVIGFFLDYQTTLMIRKPFGSDDCATQHKKLRLYLRFSGINLFFLVLLYFKLCFFR